MSIIVDIRPEVEAELARQAAAQGRAIEAYAASLLEEAAHVPRQQTLGHTGWDLVDASAKVRGLLTDEEVDKRHQAVVDAVKQRFGAVLRA